jgi:hypothetical protein
MIFNIKNLFKTSQSHTWKNDKRYKDQVDLDREEAIWANEIGVKSHPDLIPRKVPISIKPHEETMVFDSPERRNMNTHTSYDFKQMEQEPENSLLKKIEQSLSLLSQMK